jgi:sulfur-oxidizing protein SoxY
MADLPVHVAALDRRRILVLALSGGATLLGGALLARMARATPDSAKKLLESLAKGAPKEGKINLKAPEIAENGNTVPITISVDSKMEGGDRVKALHVVADGNPLPGVASFEFGPASGKVDIQIRLRLAETQKVICVAEMADGSLWQTAREIKVTIGGCGG